MSQPEFKKMSFGSACCITRRTCVIAIALLEIIYSLFGIVGYWYASYTYPLLKEFLILPTDFLNDEIIIGLINSLSILCGFEFFVALALLDGARFLKLGQIRFWLTTMLTYKMLTCVLLIGMELAGCEAPKYNAYIFISIFIRFVELLFVFVFLEEQMLKRMTLKVRCVRREALSSATSYSNISVGNEDVLEGVCIDPNPEPIINGTNSSSPDC